MAQQQQHRNPIPDGQPAVPNEQWNVPTNTSEGMLTGERNCYSKRTKCQRCCIWCSVISTVIAAIVIPVVIFVVAPGITQSLLDQTVIALPNLTQGACPTLHSYIINKASFKVPGPLLGSATIHSYTQEVYTTVCGEGDSQQGGWACDNATEALVGRYVQPEISVKQGENIVEFAVRIDLNSSTIVVNGLIFPTFGYGHKAPLILKAKDISITAMGLTMSGFHMHHEVTCSKVTALPAYTLPNSACYPDNATHVPFQAPQMYELSCVAGLRSLNMSASATRQAPMVTV